MPKINYLTKAVVAIGPCCPCCSLNATQHQVESMKYKALFKLLSLSMQDLCGLWQTGQLANWQTIKRQSNLKLRETFHSHASCIHMVPPTHPSMHLLLYLPLIITLLYLQHACIIVTCENATHSDVCTYVTIPT